MSDSPPDYEILLRDAVNKAKANATSAYNDLVRFSSMAAQAVSKVTNNSAALDLVPINQGASAQSVYQLWLRRLGSPAPPSDLGVYRLTAGGYPVMRWYSRRAWDNCPDKPDQEIPGARELEGNFRWMISQPESRLVVLVTFLEQPPTPSSRA
jgi:hypothetical protein